MCLDAHTPIGFATVLTASDSSLNVRDMLVKDEKPVRSPRPAQQVLQIIMLQ